MRVKDLIDVLQRPSVNRDAQVTVSVDISTDEDSANDRLFADVCDCTEASNAEFVLLCDTPTTNIEEASDE